MKQLSKWLRIFLGWKSDSLGFFCSLEFFPELWVIDVLGNVGWNYHCVQILPFMYFCFSIGSLCPLSNLFLICCFKSLPFKCSVVVCCSAWSVPLVFGINGFCFNQSCLEFSSSPPEWLLFFQRLSVFSFPGTMTSLLRLNSINFVNGHTWDLGPGVKARITQASGEKYAPKGISTKVCINQRFKAWKGKRSKNIQIMLQISWHCVFTIMFAVA